MSAAGEWRDRSVAVRRLATRVCFGDRVGLVVFLASLCVFGLVWRTAFLINDSYTLANGLYALERGSIHLETAAYGSTLDSPGANYYDGRTFARNYGMLVAALPVLAALRVAAAVADLRIVLVAAWCLCLLATVLVAGRVLDRRREAAVGGSVAALALFAGNVALARPLADPQFHLLALQIVHMVVAAFVGVFTYRLVAAVHDDRRGVLAAALVLLGTPLAFWASVPKRHVVTAAVVMAVAYAVHRSREGDVPHATGLRAAGYALVGLLAWVHAPEALVVFLTLVAVDVPTAPANDRRTLAVVAGAFCLSLLPMAATNLAITGNPLKVPRALRTVSPGQDLSLAGGDGSGGGGGSGSGGGSGTDGSSGTGTPGVVVFALALLESAVEPVERLFGLLERGWGTLTSAPELVSHVFVRSGYVRRVAVRASDAPAANLSVLESAPLLAGLAGVAPAAWSRLRHARATGVRGRFLAADAFVVVFAVGYSLVYVGRLPVHAQVTVRYLFPLYPLGVYGLVRLPGVGDALATRWRTAAWTYAGGVLIGGQLLLVALVSLSPGRGEAFQFHALIGLSTAALLALPALGGQTAGRGARARTAAIGLTAAATTTFLAFVSLEYYAFGDSHALPMVRALAELVAIG